MSTHSQKQLYTFLQALQIHVTLKYYFVLTICRSASNGRATSVRSRHVNHVDTVASSGAVTEVDGTGRKQTVGGEGEVNWHSDYEVLHV